MEDDLLLLAMSPNLSEEPPLAAAAEEGSGVSSKGLLPPFPTGVSSSDEKEGVGVWNEACFYTNLVGKFLWHTPQNYVVLEPRG